MDVANIRSRGAKDRMHRASYLSIDTDFLSPVHDLVSCGKASKATEPVY